jgi:hypothetical protein
MATFSFFSRNQIPGVGACALNDVIIWKENLPLWFWMNVETPTEPANWSGALCFVRHKRRCCFPHVPSPFLIRGLAAAWWCPSSALPRAVPHITSHAYRSSWKLLRCSDHVWVNRILPWTYVLWNLNGFMSWTYECVSKSFRTESIMKYTLTFGIAC